MTAPQKPEAAETPAMLLSLTIKNFVIVEHLHLNCKTGLTVLSGETGAGKSILIDALSLCLGERADTGMIAENAEQANITAVFTCPPSLNELLNSHGLASEGDNSELILRRILLRSGKSRALVNDTPVTSNLLKTLGQSLIDIHGQHAFQSLARSDEQRQLLDTHGQLQTLCQSVTEQYKHWKKLQKTLEYSQHHDSEIQQRREQLLWSLDHIEKLSPLPDEWEQLNAQHTRLSHAAELSSGVGSIAQSISESDHNLCGQVAQLINQLDNLSHKDADLKNLSNTLKEAQILLNETSRALNGYLNHTELDPEQLHELDKRIGLWHSLSRQFRVFPEELPNYAQQLENELNSLNQATDVAALHQQTLAAEAAFETQALELSKKRRDVANKLSQAVTAAMQQLNLSGGRFVCDIQKTVPNAYGIDAIEFLVSGHAGSSPKPLAKTASGGELARISLAITVITSQASSIPTLIFDEIDSGIGGAVAETVGRYLRTLAQNRQVLCVTHLPQVAAQGQQHWQVNKQFNGVKTTSHIQVLTPQEREQEIARMLGGQDITANIRATAKEMLEKK